MKKITLYYIGMRIEFDIEDKNYAIEQFKKKRIIAFEQPSGKIVYHRTEKAISMEITEKEPYNNIDTETD